MSLTGIPPSDEINERNSDNEPSLVGDDIDKYSNKGESPRKSGEGSSSEPKKSVARFELTAFDSFNPRLHQLFLQADYVECKSLIGELINQYGNDCEFALYIRGVIARIEGQLEEAIGWFEKARETSANCHIYDIELGRVSLLLGRQTNAVDYLERAIKADPNDARSYYWLARAIYHLDTDLFNPVEKSRDLLVRAPVIQLEPDNLDVMHKLGMLYLRSGDEDKAFAMFGNALSRDPTHAGSILAMGSIMQAHGDHDTALSKYRVAAELCDYNGCLWNNIGMCLFSRGKLAAAHSCLKKASFISPLDYK
ncbi:hypothetical protein WR25_27050 [Diploscapter pachys]|uniref:Uncharacterized protein n=1 Tax=Diploscapter pachys TaxID=2018661 RepID=A0A2A2KCI6_9BILA|nr:hypothetical protein WR25_27050 [Diploscapter pachys]